MSDSKTKKSAPKKVAEVVAAPSPAPVAAAAAPAKKTTTKKASPAAKVETVVPTVAAAVPAVAAPASSSEEESGSAQDRLSAVVEKLKTTQARFSTELKEIAKEALLAVKAASREIKDAKKRKRSKRPEDMTPEEKKVYEARRANNAFLKPRSISPELCAFMSIAAGSQRSQTEVTKFVSTYVKSHNCFDPANKRRILPDAALARLLKVTDKDAVTYLNLQSHLKSHFIKTQ
jgi:chromatin remodeling complex protein RSC6